MKKIYLILLNIVFIIGFVYNLSAQTSIEENNVVRADLNMMFARLLVQEKPTTGLLRDYAVDLVDLDDYDGSKLNDSTFVNHIIFDVIYNPQFGQD